MEDENANRVRNLCNEHKIKLCKASCSESTYNIIITHDKVPAPSVKFDEPVMTSDWATPLSLSPTICHQSIKIDV